MARVLRHLGAVPLLALACGVGPLRAEPASEPVEEPALPSWQLEPYWRPVAGYSVFSSGGSTYTGGRLGATAGVRAWRAPLLARARVLGAYTTGGGGVSGLDLRLGGFLGPHWEYFGAEGGVDLFWDHYQAAGVELLPASAGLDLPVNLHLGPDSFYGLAGVTPAILFAPERRVDWSSTEAFGFGHEFAWQLGLGARLGRLGVNLLYSRRTIASGTHSGWGVSLNI
jgi:hypothetical protein